MAKAQQSSPETTLQMKRTFAAPRQRVFRAWTDAAELARWFAPSADYRVVVPELDLRVGGKYRLEMHHKGGNIHRIGGTYQEILPPEKIVFTWELKSSGDQVDTLVTVEFHEVGNSTEVILTHELLPNVEERDKHAQGWTGCLEQLAKFLQA
jgi:uncharacterized protein YndB with AHSA1/START domain